MERGPALKPGLKPSCGHTDVFFVRFSSAVRTTALETFPIRSCYFYCFYLEAFFFGSSPIALFFVGSVQQNTPRDEGHLQDGVGDQDEVGYRPRGGQRRLRRPKPGVHCKNITPVDPVCVEF